jgi:hypothetical protein
MKKLLFIIASNFIVICVYPQLVNNGSIIYIQPGTTIFTTADLTNNSGTFTNNGILEVQGSFTNTAVYNSTTADDSLILSGNGNITLNGGGSTLSNLWINKSSAANAVTLAGSTSVGVKLVYDQGNFTTDPIAHPSYIFSAPASAVFQFAAGKEITGTVKRTSWSNGSPVIFNQPNMLVTTNGGTSPTDFTVTMIPQSGGGDPSQNEREVKRKFLFSQTGGSAFTSDIRYPYLDAELNTNTEANLVPWQLVSNEWNGRLAPVSRDGGLNYVSTTGINTTDLANEWKLADPRYTFNVTAALRGPWNGSTMNTSLNNAGIIPLSQPYNVTPFNYSGTESVGAIPNANVVDWVLVELRKPGSGLPSDASAASIVGRKAGFLLNNGIVTDLDGVTPIAFDISKQGAAFVVIRHRNHLGVLSNSIPSNSAGTFANDFTAIGNSYKAAGAASDPEVLLSGGVKYGLWSGDANKNGVVNVTDINVIKIAVAGSAGGYLLTDANLSNSINVTDVNLTKTTISSSGTGTTLRTPATTDQHGQVISNIPDPVQPDNQIH